MKGLIVFYRLAKGASKSYVFCMVARTRIAICVSGFMVALGTA